MKKPHKAKPPDCGIGRLASKEFDSKDKVSICSNNSAYPPKKQGNYQKLIKLVSVGDTQSTAEFLEEFGLYDVLGEFFLVNAQRCGKLEIAANFAPCEVGDE